MRGEIVGMSGYGQTRTRLSRPNYARNSLSFGCSDADFAEHANLRSKWLNRGVYQQYPLNCGRWREYSARMSAISHYRTHAASTSSAAASSRQIVGHMNRHLREAQLARRLETGMADNYDPFAVPAARLRQCTSRATACRRRRGRCGRGSSGPLSGRPCAARRGPSASTGWRPPRCRRTLPSRPRSPRARLARAFPALA